MHLDNKENNDETSNGFWSPVIKWDVAEGFTKYDPDLPIVWTSGTLEMPPFDMQELPETTYSMPLFLILIIAGSAVILVGGVASYFTVQTKKKDTIIKLIQSEKSSVLLENKKLHEDLQILQKYSDAEVNMIEAQINTFRASFVSSKMASVKPSSSNDETSLSADLQRLLVSAKELESHEVIGKGSFGEVHRSAYRGTQVAVKTLNNIDEENLDRFKAEILLMADLHHINVVALVGACWERDLMALVMEFCEKGMCTTVLKNEGANFSWDDPLLKWTMDVARALKYLHGVEYFDVKTGARVSGIIHRDLKPDNCLVTETLTIKLADFGEARAFNENNTMTQVGTPMYIAPEVVTGDRYGTSADIFSFALTVLCFALKGKATLLASLFEMLRDEGLVVFKTVSLGKVCNMLVSKGWRPERRLLQDLEIPVSIVNLLEICWPNDPEERPMASEILEYLETEGRKEILGEAMESTGGGGSRRSSTSGGLRARIDRQKFKEMAGDNVADEGKALLKGLDDLLFGDENGAEIGEREVEFAKKILGRWEGKGGGEKE
jgi:serine/threonine protein kinase